MGLFAEPGWAARRSPGRILKTLGKRSHAEVQSYLLGAALALDVQAMEAFLPDQPEEIPMPDIVTRCTATLARRSALRRT